MAQLTTKLLTSLFAVGCGSGAMANPGPGYGQWTNDQSGYAAGYPSPPDPSVVSEPASAPGDPSGYAPGYPSPPDPSVAAAPENPPDDPPGPGPSPTEPTPPAPDEESAPSPPPPQAQNAPQDRWNQDPTHNNEDEDSPQSFTQPRGQRHLGVMIMSLTPELRRFFGVTSDRGVLVARVEPGSTAARAGVQVGDVLVRVGRQQVHTSSDVIQAVQGHGAGSMRIAVVRQGRIVRLDATMPGPRRNMQQQQGPIQQDQI